MSTPHQTPDGWRCDTQPSNLRRAQWMDYRDPAILLITMVTTDRLPLLGELQGERVALSSLGVQVAQEIERIPSYKDAAAIEIYDYVVMPDHVHILLHIHERLPKHIGRYLYWFKLKCTDAYTLIFGDTNARGTTRENITREEPYTPTGQVLAGSPITPALWGAFDGGSSRNKSYPFAPEYHDRILKGKEQLSHMKRYIKDNPRRLALKRANKELFRIHQDTLIKDIPCTTLGNMFLADYPLKQVVQCSRRLTQTEIDALKTQYLKDAAEGVVHITAAISEGEKQIARALREAEYPLIVLLHEGFPKPENPHYQYYKPSGVYFEACAKGKLLLLEPHQEVLELPDIVAKTEDKVGKIPHTSQRYRFVAMNNIADLITSSI